MSRIPLAPALLALVALVLLKLLAGAPASDGAAAESAPSAVARDGGEQTLEAAEDALERSATAHEAPVRPPTPPPAGGEAEPGAPLVRFRLVDAVTGAPIVGAEIHLGGSPLRVVARATSGSARPFRAYEPTGTPAARSGERGEFRLPMAEGLEIATVHAEGYGPGWVHALLSPDPATPRKVALQPEAILEGTVERLPGERAGELQVIASANTGALDGTWMSGSWHFWSATPGAGGSVHLAGLPAHVPLELSLVRGEEQLRAALEVYVLEPGEVRRFTWEAGTHALEGVLVDPDEPPEDRRVVLFARAGEAVHRLVHRGDRPIHGTRTGPGGTFAFEDVAAGAYWLSEAPPSLGGTKLAVAVTVPADESVVLELPEWLTIEGRVTDRGSGVPGASVTGRRADFIGVRRTEAREDGSFTLRVPRGGEWRLRASERSRPGSGSRAPSSSVPAQAGARGVQLELTEAAELRGRVVDGQGDPAPAAGMVLLRDDTGASVKISNSTAFAFRQLAAGRYAVFAYTLDGRAGVTEEVTLAAGEERADLVVRLAEAAEVRLAEELQLQGAQLVLLRDGRARASFSVLDPLVRSWSAPPGTYAVRYREHYAGAYRELGTVTLRTGETTTIGE